MNNLNKEDLQFLKELAHKRKTQEKDCCADPVFWMIQDEKNIYCEDGEYYEFYDEGDLIYSTYYEFNEDDLKEFKEYVLNHGYISKYDIDDFKNISDEDELEDFINYNDIHMNYARFTREYFISNMTGPFLTKEAAKKHLKDNYYHYSKNAGTYGMVGWRNPEFERLMKIVEKFDDGELIC